MQDPSSSFAAEDEENSRGTVVKMSDTQMGFRARFGTIDQIFNLRIIMEKSREHGVPIDMAFVDYKKAFDSICHKRLWDVLNRMGISKQTVTAIKNLYEHQKATVRADKEFSEWFQIGKGVRQGCLI